MVQYDEMVVRQEAVAAVEVATVAVTIVAAAALADQWRGLAA